MTTIFSESFETDGNGTRYTTSVPEFSDGFGDFFTRTDGSNIGSFYEVAGADGSFWFAAMDIDGEGAASEQTLTFSGIDIAGFTDLSLSFLAAEDDDGTNEDWDTSDFVHVAYRIDGGAFQNAIQFESVRDGDDFNAVPAVDTDFDGDGDGTEVTDTFQTFSAVIAETGATLDLRVTFDLDSGDEDFSLDDIVLEGTAPAAAPRINEIRPNPPGTDPATQTVELRGTPGALFSGYLVSIESDLGAPGAADRFTAVSGTFDANGLLTADIPDLENPSFTLVLTDSFAGDGTTDIDVDNDGTVDDLSDFAGTIFDAIGVPDAAGEPLYGVQLGGTDLAFIGSEPELLFREAATGDLFGVDFNGDVYDAAGSTVPSAEFDIDPTVPTFGAVNPTRTAAPVDPFTLVETDGSTDVTEDGATDTVSIQANIAATADVTFEIDFDEVQIAGPDDTFTQAIAAPGNLGDIIVAAIDDAFDEADVHTGTITVTTTSADPNWNGLSQTITVDIADNDDPVITPIYEIQGAGHVSPFVLGGATVTDFFATLPADTFNVFGSDVTTTGIVTAVDSNGFYLQDPAGDADNATSEAIFVFTSSAPGVSVGDGLTVSGTVAEFFPGDTDTRNLPTTQITSPTITVDSTGNALPGSVILGAAGRPVPVNGSIDDDAFTAFEEDLDGIDYFESLEAMLVTVDDPFVVNGTNRFGEIFTVADGGAASTSLSARGTLNIGPGDFNPERLQIDEDTGILPGFSLPSVDVGGTLDDVIGVVSYDFGNFQVHPTQPFGVASASRLTGETTSLAGSTDQLTVASYNVLNLDPNDADGDTDIAGGRFAAIAAQIVANLDAPDIIALQEVQDNDGSVNSGVTAADLTLQTLVDAIVAAGGPTYTFVDNTFITDGASGGQPGGNIRTAFLYDASRVSLNAGTVEPVGSQGSGEAFNGARLPLSATFTFNGHDVTVVNNHLSSKGGSAPILGIEQDFAARQEDVSVNGSLDERQTQSQAVQDYVDAILTTDANANVVVLGDMNEFEFVSPVADLETDSGLTNLTNTLDANERYSFIFQGNSQSLDHILVSDALAGVAEFDIVHVNTEFVETSGRASDHDPLIARFDLSAPDVEPPLLAASVGDVDAFATPFSFVGSVTATDDVDGAVEATLVSGNEAGLFAYDPLTGALTLAQRPLEGDGPFTLGFEAQDAAGNTSTPFTIDIAITDVDEIQTDLRVLSLQSDDDIVVLGGGNNLLLAGGGADTVLGRQGADQLLGNGGNDDLDGGQDRDLIVGGRGMDTGFGGGAADVLIGNRGDDLLLGEGGPDVLKGGRANDVLIGGPGDDILSGNAGSDVLIFEPGFGHDTARGFDADEDLLDFQGQSVSYERARGGTLFTVDADNTVLVRGLSVADAPSVIFDGLAVV